MPSARSSNFRGGGGIPRDQDGVIVGLEFTDKNPLYTGPKPDGKKSDFRSLWAVVRILIDGATAPTLQPIFVGDADAFGITADKTGLTGDGEVSKSSGWFVFLNSLSNPGGVTGSGFDETNFPDDDPKEANWGAIVGARVRFNWQKNEKATKKYGQKVSSKDPKKKYDREDLIVTNYYGQVEVTEEMLAGADEAPVASAAKAVSTGRAASAPTTKTKPAAAAKGGKVDIATTAIENITTALKSVKAKDDGTRVLSKSKLSVKILSQMSTADPEVRSEVRDWAFQDANLQNVPNVVFDSAKQELTYVEPDAE